MLEKIREHNQNCLNGRGYKLDDEKSKLGPEYKKMKKLCRESFKQK